ncbi:MAG: Transcriptional regulator, NifA, Fis Family [Thermodesulfobacterium sp. 37_54]|uniref:sigma-54 interaction domain-containing protein n=1 Tax=Thermodesulfobacterium commune TaxID=1741 RepID=UPI000748E8A6|nr:MAG: Transcriptional regulator, NifA, Fis Family [Thermodesulfobacterium sp. 37_54]MDK2862192.1 Nif-specific regulatory protein [Thermodesulfobacterium sp.]HBT03627.1 sigma-54-dependent Fis family transcriptional regulator [Thermodesulfobacterium commune]HCE79306.1 sigma-54-dependent Fis family transcriptional regulator [Thermodesulfobacterium commune]HCP09115.1 sigma-54-dependent Fis family transcriptional regulator [Thermodesulfobacterium commune]
MISKSQKERAYQELFTLFKVSKVLSSSLNVLENLKNALQILAEDLYLTRGTVTLLDPAVNELKIAVAYGLTEEQIRRGRYKIGEGIVGKVFESGQPMIVPNIGEEPMFLNKTGARVEKDKISFLCVPIKLGDEIFGVLSVDRIFDVNTDFAEDLRVLEILATLFAQIIKIYNLLYEEKKKREFFEKEVKKKYQFYNLVYSSEQMRQIIKICEKISSTKAPVLIQGESGTGKELIAKAIHFNSDRADKPFIAINCAAIPENLLEAELFGYEKGAFTGAFTSKPGKFELANGGTLFLDEIGDLPLSLQAKLLRVLQEHTFERLGGTKSIKVDFRLISATHKNLKELISQGKFREDLYFRINVVNIYIPPLRERKEDIVVLIEHFLNQLNQKYQKSVKISKEVLKIFLEYPWPGNVRELENTLESMVILSDDELITPEHLPEVFKSCQISQPKSDVQESSLQAINLKQQIEEEEKQRIISALKACKFNQTQAAKLLGMTRRQLNYRLHKYGII